MEQNCYWTLETGEHNDQLNKMFVEYYLHWTMKTIDYVILNKSGVDHRKVECHVMASNNI
jgi:hypothetical protein